MPNPFKQLVLRPSPLAPTSAHVGGALAVSSTRLDRLNPSETRCRCELRLGDASIAVEVQLLASSIEVRGRGRSVEVRSANGGVKRLNGKVKVCGIWYVAELLLDMTLQSITAWHGQNMFHDTFGT